jgi:multiple sugar transport system permease protein
MEGWRFVPRAGKSCGRNMSTILRRHPLVLLVLFAPALLVVGVFMVWPLVNGVLLSFTDASPMRPRRSFVGLENYEDLLTDPKFWEIVGNSFGIILASILIATIAGFAIALALNTGIRAVRFFRMGVFQVWIVPWITVAILWGWIFNADYGVVNFILLDLGVIATKKKWLAESFLAQGVIVAGFAWRLIPFMMVVSLAAVQSVPRELMEAAAIDGAGYARQIRSVVLPLTRNVMLSVALLQAVKLFQEITLPWILTQGGPVNATTMLALFTYKLAFSQWDFGLASAAGTIWLAILLVFASAYVRLLARPS